MAKKIRILVADDHAIFRHGLKDILLEHFPGVSIGEAETGRDLLERVRKARWDLVLMDVTMPGGNGIDVLQEIRQVKPAPPVLVLSMHPEEQYGIRMLKAGAAGYLTKIQAPLEIVGAIKRVLAGGKYVSSTLAGRLLAQMKPGTDKLPHDRLSKREHQVMRLLPSGKSLKAIAAELSVCSQTVSTHRTRILKKMGLHSNAGLIRYAVENGLVD